MTAQFWLMFALALLWILTPTAVIAFGWHLIQKGYRRYQVRRELDRAIPGWRKVQL